jgi:hypothetical protein
MAVQTYEVLVSANALRTIKVRAASGREALDIANERIKPAAGTWTISFPGAEDEHYMVTRVADDTIIGPGVTGAFADEDSEAGE